MLRRGICSCLGKTQINGLKRWDAATNELASLLPFLLRVDSRARYWTYSRNCIPPCTDALLRAEGRRIAKGKVQCWCVQSV